MERAHQAALRHKAVKAVWAHHQLPGDRALDLTLPGQVFGAEEPRLLQQLPALPPLRATPLSVGEEGRLQTQVTTLSVPQPEPSVRQLAVGVQGGDPPPRL